ncbi:MAG: radical SAM/SPASM domain-containing protein, partial [Gemmatimonadales bacterium]|nr:radical SAM/SPASM domain-containing protein [Gemmatimonadales bacterium]
PAQFLAMLRNSLAQAHADHGRPQGREKDHFAMSELLVAHARGQRDVGEMARYLKYRYEFAVYPARKILKPFPIVLAVEPTSVCNLRCPMCFIVDPRLSRNRELNGMMKLELFQRVMDEAGEHGLNGLVMASRGEPTLNPAFPDMLAYARKRGVLDIKINTNATKLTPELSRRILAADPDLVVFSVDTAEREVYGEIRVGADFDAVLNNVETFVKLRDQEFPGNRTVTRASMVVTREDQRIDTSRAFWLHRVDEVGVNPVFERLNIYDLPEKPIAVPCSILWERMYVWWDGGVNPCDADYLSHLSPGRIGEGQTVASLWTGQHMQSLREFHQTGRKNACSPCNKCTGY